MLNVKSVYLPIEFVVSNFHNFALCNLMVAGEYVYLINTGDHKSKIGTIGIIIIIYLGICGYLVTTPGYYKIFHFLLPSAVPVGKISAS